MKSYPKIKAAKFDILELKNLILEEKTDKTSVLVVT